MQIGGLNTGNNYKAGQDRSIAASKAYAAANPGGGIGGSIGRFFGADLTPGFNVRNPFNNAAPAPQGAAPAQTIDNSGGGGGGGTTNLTTANDPYAAWGGGAAGQQTLAALQSGFANQKGGIYGSANDAAQNLQAGYGQTIQDTIHNLQQGQLGIDRKSTQNEASHMQGAQGILGMVSRGIKSGGVMLGNRNAGNSSAAGAIAQAYGDQGRQQMSTIGNQYAQNQGDIAIDQGNQDYAVAQAPNKFHVGLMDNVNSIVSAAGTQLSALDADMANASLPERIAIEQEKQAIKAQVLGHLQQYDAQLQAGVGGIHAASRDQNRTAAQSQISAGQADPNSFQYTDQAPGEFQNTGPAASGLPLYTMNKRQRFA